MGERKGELIDFKKRGNREIGRRTTRRGRRWRKKVRK